MSATDPFCEIESSLLWHLATAHNDVAARLIDQAYGLAATQPAVPTGPWAVTACDSAYKVTTVGHEIRLPFHKPVDDMTGLNQAIRVLLGCPSHNGLQSQQ
ncbi:hypothetical protein DIJ64_00400 [Mycobacterium leprae]|uniref:DUF2470 domain-containing protein n=1 Tax=Mycobacterium leprae TaxID=1769 RepID=A0AAD0KUM8_MYCLR|nr:hypothetical protein DIJ64_00400 [Mycobacterium leprae]OAR21316.1 hypothetical protein A8144_06850 [Mycobacterium leprae 3125609]OAX71401.1 hypothetical protein A3216_06025 [Mycobacterium leprae 7935681]